MDSANICARKGCDNQYTRKTHNQKYCSDECCRRATNDKIMVRYYENKLLRSGKPRYCDCGAKLSKYNFTKQCATCESLTIEDDVRDVMDVMSVVVWD